MYANLLQENNKVFFLSIYKIKVANDSPCSSCKIPNAMNFKYKINFEIEPFENLGRCRTSHGNTHIHTVHKSKIFTKLARQKSAKS